MHVINSVAHTLEVFEVFVIDPVHMETMYGNRLDAVVDGGLGMERPTTVVDLTDVPFEVVREGQGSVELF